MSFSSGEWSPLLDARSDHPKYRNACRKLQNMIAMKQGGATRRPGSIFIAEAKYPDANLTVRLMKFQFSPTTSFIFEFGHYYIRFYSNGQRVMRTSASLWVNGQAYGPGNYVQDPTDMLVYMSIDPFVFTSTVQPHLDAVHWLQTDIYEVPSPYPADTGYGAVVLGLVPCQVNDVVYLVHPDYPPYRLTRLTDTNWVLEEVQYITPPQLDQNASNTTLAASATTGSGITLTASAPAWVTATYYQIGNSVLQGGVIYNCLVNHVSGTFATDLAAVKWEAATIFANSNIGSVWKLSDTVEAAALSYNISADGTSSTIAALGTWSVDTYGAWNADIAVQRSLDNGVTWVTILTITSREDHNTTIPGKAAQLGLYRFVITNWTAQAVPTAIPPRVVFNVVNYFLSGVVKIASVIDAYNATANVITELADTTATVYWSEGAWSIRRGYPRAVTAFQQRLIYGGSSFEPQRIWGSVTNDIENFELGDQTLATDAFAFDIAAVGRGPIQWLIAQVDLFCGFSGAEWIINAGSGAIGGSTDAITPTQISAGEHSSWGSAPSVPPAVVGNAVLYTQRSAKTIQQMLFSVYTNKYMSADLTSLSEHLFGSGIVQIDYQPQFRNQGVVWAVTESGSLAGMTYQLEQEVFAWHRHITGLDADGIATDVGFISVAVIEGTGTNDDEVWVAVRRSTGVFIELINPVNWETAGAPVLGVAQPSQADAFYVDSGITVTNPATNVIPGLDHLIGRTVCCLINGGTAVTDLVVDGSGQVTIDNYEPEAGDVLQIGLPIDYAVMPMRMDSDPRAGFTSGITKVISKLFISLFNSLGGKVVQPETSNEAPINYRGQVLGLLSIFTGIKTVQPHSNPGLDPSFIVEGRDPFPVTIRATVTRIDLTGGA